MLGGTDSAKILLDNIRKERVRYVKDQLGVIVKAVPNYDFDTIEKSIEYCVSRRLWSAGTFKDALEHISIEKNKNKSKKTALNNTSIPSKCKGVKTEIRSISEYTNALKEDNTVWKN